ncbi:glutamate-5-semialdehyde dehydrogenase [Trueperella bialowiezensis]|uniref:Gamma-glutamyl phosphate reductase n=1 Tax=Trueperella bialowiezensis TaxID=312285 RepID=A0A448PGL5_9ACTO|nr:Gamma-glutamyl phosphate reductase [Trueperella bialowiezensis]
MVSMSEANQAVRDLATKAKDAARALRVANTAEKNAMLAKIADELLANEQNILDANREDVEREKAAGMSAALIDRLLLTSQRLADIAQAVRDVASLADPVGEIVEGRTLDNGLRLTNKRVPMGVIGMIYEARPNVTVDAAVLALKAGNAVLLRGGSAALESNRVLVAAIRAGIDKAGFSPDLVASVDDYGRDGAVALMRARGYVDLVIPRGGAGLIQTVIEQATVPTIETGVGNCHIYVDSAADVDRAHDVVVNAKTHRPGVCNAVETVLVHRDVAGELLPRLGKSLGEAGVTIHADAVAAELIADAVPATEADWETEYLALELAVRVVDNPADAVAHIAQYSSGHTEAIISENVATVNMFTQAVDSAVVMVNASTRFTDGGQFGLGAEIGISTQKLHARGPMALRELTTTTWIVQGDGHVRQ